MDVVGIELLTDAGGVRELGRWVAVAGLGVHPQPVWDLHLVDLAAPGGMEHSASFLDVSVSPR